MKTRLYAFVPYIAMTFSVLIMAKN